MKRLNIYINKSIEKKYEIVSSYEYIGIKLLHIVRMYLKGERFPEGILSKEDHHAYLLQTINFITQNDNLFELVQLNAKSYFAAVSEIFLNKNVSSMLIQLNSSDNADSSRKTPHQLILSKLIQSMKKIADVRYIEFELWLFIIKISASDWMKLRPELFATDIAYSIILVLENIKRVAEGLDIRDNISQSEPKYIGPKDIEKSEVEADIVDIVPSYIKDIEPRGVDIIVLLAKGLGVDLIIISIYEYQCRFEEWIDTFLISKSWKSDSIFQWFKSLFKKIATIHEEDVSKIKAKILNVIADLVNLDSIKTREVIDAWLPNSQKDVIEKLQHKPKLQLKYLKDYIWIKETEIRENMLLLNKSPKTKEEIEQYRKYLFLHVKLLAEQESPELKEVVMKDFYPIQCLDGIKSDSYIVREALAYLKKRSEMFSQSIDIFLSLMSEITLEKLEFELYKGKSVSN